MGHWMSEKTCLSNASLFSPNDPLWIYKEIEIIENIIPTNI